jgi:3-oxoacyl-[acyl-carrier protein] reductase
MWKIIFITWSSRWIGKAIAKEAYAQGYTVIIHGKTDSSALNETANELPGVFKAVFDIANKEEVKNEISRIMEKAGGIDILVNNAGVAKNFIKDISEMATEKALEEWNTNVLGTIHCIQAVLPKMVEQKSGCIINIASIKWHPNLSTMSTFTYAQTKAAILSLTKSLAKTYAHYNIRVNSISPWYIETDQVALWNEDTFKRIREGTLLGRIGTPEEISWLALFLASDKASYITGADFLVDGGYTLKGK